MKKSFKLFIDSLDVLDELTDEQAGQLFKAIRAYEVEGVETLNGLMKAIFTPFKNNIDRAKVEYQAVCERNRANGMKGGRPNPSKPTGLKSNPKNPDKDKDKDKDKDNNKKLPTKKPKDFLYENDFEQLWKIYNVGDKWAAYKSWHFRKKDYTGEELTKALRLEDTKQFGKRHFSTVLNSDLDEILKATPIKKPHPYESGLS